MIGFLEEQEYGLTPIWRCCTSHQDRNFFMFLMLLILVSLLARILYLAIIYVPPNIEYYYAIWLCNLPTDLKLLTVMYICQFKIHTYYVAKQEKGPIWVTWLILGLTIIVIAASVSLSFSSCSAMS